MQLLERETQLEALMRHLHEARHRAGKIAFVTGEAGAGKSALIEQFASARNSPRSPAFHSRESGWTHFP